MQPRQRLSALVQASAQRQQQPLQQPLSGSKQQQQAIAAFSRSDILRLALASAAAGSSLLLLPSLPANAAAAAAAATALPALKPASGLLTGPRSSLVLADPLLLPIPPGPIAFPRRQLSLNFAVMLMRTGYEAVDDLDFIPMVSSGASLCGVVWCGCDKGVMESWADFYI